MKLLRSLTLLALVGSVAAVAQESGSSGLSAWATGHVFAKIVPSLTIKEDVAMHFGRVLEGSYGKIEINEITNAIASKADTLTSSGGWRRGEFTVNAPDYSDFSVDFDSGGTPIATGSTKKLTLSSGSNTLDVDVRLYSKFALGAVPPGSANAWKIYVGGTLTVPEKAPVGLYSGTYKLVATYY